MLKIPKTAFPYKLSSCIVWKYTYTQSAVKYKKKYTVIKKKEETAKQTK